MSNKFTNPYDLDSSVPEKRVHTEVSREDYLLVKLMRPDQGTIKNVIGLLWKQLCYELRTRNLTDNTSCQQFEHFIANCRIVPADEYERLCNLASSVDNRTGPETNGGNERGRAKKLPGGGADKSRKRADVSSGSSSQGGEGVGKSEKD